MEVSFLEKPALAMNIEDFANGLNAERARNKAIVQMLMEKGIYGQITPSIVRQLKAKTFNSVGTLTLEGLMDIFYDLKRAGLTKHATVKGYMSRIEETIKETIVA